MRYHVYWLIETSFGPVYEIDINASNGFRNLNPPFFLITTRFACDSQASHARESVINGCYSILDAYDAGKEAIFDSVVDSLYLFIIYRIDAQYYYHSYTYRAVGSCGILSNIRYRKPSGEENLR
jgi:hypothetical protein